MRRFVALFFLAFSLLGTAVAQQMTDDQVVQYVKSAQQTGKTQKEIATALMRRGVTKEQIERIRKKYESNQSKQGAANGLADERSRQRRLQAGNADGFRMPEGMAQGGVLAPNDSIKNDSLFFYKKKVDPTRQIFGHNIFTNPNLTFEPNVNVATPVDYRLGPGDEVIIDVWGASETTIRQTISPEGSILVNNLGPVYLNGKTVAEANEFLKEEFARIYSGVSGNMPSTQVKLTLGETRSIQVNVMGEVMVPGTYTLSSFASVFHALYRAGGVNKIGSLRNIRVVRDGKVIANLDVYNFIMEGKMKDDIRLQDGDVILVEPYMSLVRILGK